MRADARVAVRDPALAEAMRAVRARYEANGAARGVAHLEALAPEESRALDRLWPASARRRPRAGRPFDLDLARWDAHLRAELGIDLREALELAGGALDPRPQRLSRLKQRKDAFWSNVRRHPLCLREPSVLVWIDRLRDTGRPLGAQPWESNAERRLDGALTVGYELPRHPPVERSALAAELLNGDAHALDDDQPVARLLIGQLAVRAGLTATPRSAAEVRVLWQRFGVLCDSASATVLALNLAPVPSTPLAQAIGLMHGQHVALTLGQLQRTALRFAGCAEAFLCENPTVLLRIESELGASSPPLVCTGGWPNGAVCTLFDQLRSSSVALRHHGDFDWAGLDIFGWLRRHYGVTSWCFDRPSYEVAVRGRGDRLAALEVERAKFPDDDPLAAALAEQGRVVPEELVLSDLVGDLKSRSAGGDRTDVSVVT
ncbi:MAG TPA: TIGR02679 family protein [Solirubrobacteraceae bacterium]|nr:TIGR02679 family protein [Solirubrobacteraceae bacterium]